MEANTPVKPIEEEGQLSSGVGNLMSFLDDLLTEAAEWLFGGLGPSTDRGQFVLLSAIGLALCVVDGWLFLTSANPLTEPDWGWGAVAAGIVLGAGGIIWSGLHLIRGAGDRGLAIIALVTNIAAVMIAFLCVA